MTVGGMGFIPERLLMMMMMMRIQSTTFPASSSSPAVASPPHTPEALSTAVIDAILCVWMLQCRLFHDVVHRCMHAGRWRHGGAATAVYLHSLVFGCIGLQYGNPLACTRTRTPTRHKCIATPTEERLPSCAPPERDVDSLQQGQHVAKATAEVRKWQGFFWGGGVTEAFIKPGGF